MEAVNDFEQCQFKNVLVTGGAGFIGTNFIKYMLGTGSLKPDNIAPFAGRIVNFDRLTYAGNPSSLSDVAEQYSDRYCMIKGDICDASAVESVLRGNSIDAIVHFAAESHVDRSIASPESFVRTNVLGTFNLLEGARQVWQGRRDVLFHHVSTDEVYGSLGDTGKFLESTPYDPRSPYSASKAGSDHLVKAYSHTFGLPVTMSNCSNNYGPYQFPEKLIPLMILNMLEGKSLPVYGDGKYIRDWLYVEDHNSAVWSIMNRGKRGSCYNVGGENEWENIKLLRVLIKLVARLCGKDEGKILDTITFVKDRPGHDRRYAINCDKLKSEIGWRQSVDFSEGLERTVRWYLDHPEWVAAVKSGSYRNWIEANYQQR